MSWETSKKVKKLFKHQNKNGETILCSHLVVGSLFNCAVISAHQGWWQRRFQSGGQDISSDMVGPKLFNWTWNKVQHKKKYDKFIFFTLSPTSVVSIRAALVAAPDPVWGIRPNQAGCCGGRGEASPWTLNVAGAICRQWSSKGRFIHPHEEGGYEHIGDCIGKSWRTASCCWRRAVTAALRQVFELDCGSLFYLSCVVVQYGTIQYNVFFIRTSCVDLRGNSMM